MTLTKLIASVVKRLSDNKTTVISVCTDNAKYNVSALNGDKNSAQQLSGEPIIRQPRAAHTANLALKDLLLLDEKYGFVSFDINILMKNKSKGSYRDGFSPEFRTERWSSLFRCSQFLRKNYALYQKVENEEVANSLSRTDELIGWENLHHI